MNPLNRPKKENKKLTSNEQRMKLKSILKEKREVRAVRPDHHTTPASYADALKTPAAISPRNPEPTAAQSSGSNITELFKQLHDPECIEMFQILKKFIAISKSGKPTSDRFTEITTLLQIDTINV
ncbi:hypothetical protein NPIL_155201 [Nephila pilipes]|uniref:Uncharacterized protein n=1 Tax=Nephila pilipes TaxID=299642 RepID=A0A8X6QAT9_NEPPI|nr:hypothetical protein NPIL_155201 [Nephila pilipes]